MHCQDCGAAILAGFSYCRECGAPQHRSGLSASEKTQKVLLLLSLIVSGIVLIPVIVYVGIGTLETLILGDFGAAGEGPAGTKLFFGLVITGGAASFLKWLWSNYTSIK